MKWYSQWITFIFPMRFIYEGLILVKIEDINFNDVCKNLTGREKLYCDPTIFHDYYVDNYY